MLTFSDLAAYGPRAPEPRVRGQTGYRGQVKLMRAVSVCTPRISRSGETPVVVRGLKRAHSPRPSRLQVRAPVHTGSGLPQRRGLVRGGETRGGSESRSRISPRQSPQRK